MDPDTLTMDPDTLTMDPDTLVTPWTLAGHRLDPATGRYRKIGLDGEGRLEAESLEVAFAIGADGKSVDLFDMRSGDQLRDFHAAEEEFKRLRALLSSAKSPSP